LKLGYVSADARPWAFVELADGRRLGETPLSRYPLPEGKHVLVFKHPSHKTVRREVRVREGAELQVHVELKP